MRLSRVAVALLSQPGFDRLVIELGCWPGLRGVRAQHR